MVLEVDMEVALFVVLQPLLHLRCQCSQSVSVLMLLRMRCGTHTRDGIG